MGGLGKTYKDHWTGEKLERTNKQRIIGGLTGAAGLGYLGYATGSGIGAVRNAVKWNSGHRPRPAMPDWLKGAKNKADAKRAYRAQSRKAHPDLGGSHEAQKRVNHEWESHESFFKEAMLRSFANELEKIAAIRSYATR